MGKLVHFTKSDRTKSAHTGKTGGAQVVIFTGVRYQRDEKTAEKKSSVAVKRRRKRV